MPDSMCGLTKADPLTAVLEDAQVSTSSHILVTGPSGLSALLWLCRQGYQQVGYLRSGRGCPHEDADALLVADTCDPAKLDRLLANGPHVREGGVLVFRSPQPAANEQTDPIHQLLAEHGYRVERCLHGSRRELHVARRQPRRLKAAA